LAARIASRSETSPSTPLFASSASIEVVSPLTVSAAVSTTSVLSATLLIAIVTVATFELAEPSNARYVKVSVP
jgi:hypothetical protein